MVSIYGRLCFLRALSQPKRVVVVGKTACARACPIVHKDKVLECCHNTIYFVPAPLKGAPIRYTKDEILANKLSHKNVFLHEKGCSDAELGISFLSS